MQLVAYGAQDIYLTGNPQITFFKVVYRRHTNFSMESIEQTFNGTAGLGKRVTATISRNGDLVNGMWLEVQTTIGGGQPADYGFGNNLVKTAELEIGGQLIDKHYGEWMNIWGELSTPAGKLAGYDAMVGNSGFAQNDSNKALDVPLQFWFCRNPGLALPLIALQYHEVKLVLEFRTEAEVSDGGATMTLNSTKLWVDYVYLDTDERRRFAQISHEYLIEQVQFTGDESVTDNTDKKMTLNFNHPCKELIWVVHTAGQPLLDFTATFTKAKLQLNGHDRFAERRMEYFSHVQPYKHHTRVARTANNQDIFVYSFALQPEEHQPSGTCNFSRIDNAVLTMTAPQTVGNAAGVCKVFAVNYNVLRIMSGMGGLAYSN
jgi:hypothetical protein